MFTTKIFAWIVCGVLAVATPAYWDADLPERGRSAYMAQMGDDDAAPAEIRRDYSRRNLGYACGGVAWLLFGCLLFHREIHDTIKPIRSQFS